MANLRARQDQLPPVLLAAYAAPGLAFAIPTIPLYVYLPAFYADELGLGLAATGTAILIARIFDALSDPVVGYLSDRVRSRFGLRKPWIVLGAVVAAIGMAMVALPPAGIGAAYLTAALVVLYAGWTAASVPYNAWGAELATGYDERTRIVSAREGAGIVGILLASILPAVVAGSSADRLLWTTVAAIVVGLVAITAMARLVPDVRLVRESRPGALDPGAIGTLLRDMARNDPFLRLGAAWFANGLANGLPAALFILFMTYALAIDARIQPLYVLAYFLAAVIALPGVYALSRALGKHRAWCVSMIVACCAFAVVPFLGPGSEIPFFIVCIVTGTALGADLVLPPALQADVVDLDRLRHGEERTGAFFAAWSFTSKTAAAIAGGFGLIAVGAGGFAPGSVDPEGVAVLMIAYAVVPIALKLVAIALLWSFPITPARHSTIRRMLAARRLARLPDDPPGVGEEQPVR